MQSSISMINIIVAIQIMYIDELHRSAWLMDEFRAEKLNLYSIGEPKTENKWANSKHLQQMFYGINKKMLHSPHHAQIMKNK